MFKLAVFVAMMAASCQAAPKPGYLHQALAYPVATSHSSRIDIHSKPIVVAAGPAILHAPLVHAPIVKAYAPIAPIVKTIYPAAVSHSSRYDVHSAPLVSYGHSHGYYGHGLGGLDYGHGYGGYGLGLGYGHHGLFGHY